MSNYTINGIDPAPLEDMYPCDPSGLDGFACGAAVAFGLMGMAEAIRTWPDRRPWRCCDCGRMCTGGEGWCRECSPEKFI